MLIAGIQPRMVTSNVYQQNRVAKQQNTQVNTPSFQKGAGWGIGAVLIALLSLISFGFFSCRSVNKSLNRFNP